jgi:UDP-N-acetylmuramyl pentapeptide phosphotransferase/UDP-N-acetylglucosamine-1-phosphate transferase
MNSITNPLTSLKCGAIAFAVLWPAWMVWWSGSFAPANIIILTICGAVAGYLWFRIMRWQFRRMGMLPREDSSSTSAK